MMNVVLIASFFPLAVSEANSSEVSPSQQQHVLILATTDVEKRFIGDAAAVAVGAGLVPVTMDEVNALLEGERIKDLTGCNDVTCIAELSGANGIRLVAKIKPDPGGVRAVITIHDISKMGERVVQQLVSKESAAESLIASIEDYKRERARLLELLERIPCGYPWDKLEAVLGPPHFGTYTDAEKYYFDLRITVQNGGVQTIRAGRGGGRSVMSCSSQRPPSPRSP